MTNNANKGNPKIQDNIGITIDSGETKRREEEKNGKFIILSQKHSQ